MYAHHLLLKWKSNTNNTLFINPYGVYGICALLCIRRGGQHHEIPIYLPQEIGLAVDVFERAWYEQGEEWEPIDIFIGGMPVNAKAFWLPMGSLIWVEQDLMGAPCDSCQFTTLTKEEWIQSKEDRVLASTS